MKIEIADGLRDARLRRFITAPPPFRVEYPYGLPGDSFRDLAKDYNATCVAYHKGVDPRALSEIAEAGNAYRYGPGDQRYEEIKLSMIENGFIGGDAQRIIVHVDGTRAWIAEGNHRMRIALEVGVAEVEVEIRYLKNADETYHLIPIGDDAGLTRFISE